MTSSRRGFFGRLAALFGAPAAVAVARALPAAAPPPTGDGFADRNGKSGEVLVSNGGDPTWLLPPEAPTTLIALPQRGGKLILCWNQRGHDADNFEVVVRDFGGTHHCIVPPDDWCVCVDGLTPNETAVASVRAFNAAGASAWSRPVEACPLP